MEFILKVFVLTFIGATLVFSKPAPIKRTPPPPSASSAASNSDPKAKPPDTGLYYDQYLQRVVKLLEGDENFRKTMESANFEDIKAGKVSNHINKIPKDIRRKLDEAKREEIARLRKIVHAKLQVDQGQKVRNTNYLKEIANHLDSKNAHTFEAQDLTNLIKAASKDLESYDQKRHQEFKNYEMNKELRRREKLRQMSDADRKKAEKEYKEMRQKHENHPAMNHPGSKAQMQEVWEEEDGLKGQEFNPKTFFRLHDINSDSMLDPMELEALFEKDLAKAYDPNNPEDDMFEMEEERRRMREHVMKEVDSDKNGLISYEEFMKYTKSREFSAPDPNSYKTVDQMIDDDEVYTKDELSDFREMIEQREAEVKRKLEELREQARNVVSLKSEVYHEEKKIGENAPEHEKAALEEKKQGVKDEEEVLKEMHEELKQQSKEIQEMKKELRKHENNQNTQNTMGENKLHVDMGQQNVPPVPGSQQFQRLQPDGAQRFQQQQYQQPQGGQQYQQPHGSQQFQQHHQGGQQYQPPQGGQQYQQPPGGRQFQQPQGDQQYQQPQGGQQYQQPQGGQQYQQPQGGQQYQQPHDGQQYQQPQGGQQYQQPQGGQQYQQPQDGQQHQQPQGGQQYQQSQDGQQFQQPQGGQQYQHPQGSQKFQQPQGTQQFQQPQGGQQFQYPQDGQEPHQQPQGGQQDGQDQQ